MSDAVEPGDKASVLVIGESLIDIIHSDGSPAVEIVGGSPANVALGLGRLGDKPRLLTALGGDTHGRTIADHLERSGVTVDQSSWSLGRTATALATIRPGGVEYDFDIEWRLPLSIELENARVVHVGSIAAFLAPGADTITALLADISEHVLITFDPNIRASLIGPHSTALERVLRLTALADVVKLSDEDAAWLWPSATPDEILDLLLDAGASLVALTLGGSGAIAATRQSRVRVVAPSVPVIDTVGAGDTFMAALIHQILKNPHLVDDAHESNLCDAVEFAVVAASITVQRAGADLPFQRDIWRVIKDRRTGTGDELSENVILYATFTARAGEADRVAALLSDYARLVRQESGNLVFDACRQSDALERFFVYEAYRDDHAFQEHLASPDGQAFNDELTPLIVEPASELTFLCRAR